MKLRILIIVLAVSIIMSAGIAGINQKLENEVDFSMMVISDTHILAEEQIGSSISADLNADEATGQKMLFLSEAVFRTTIDKFIASGSSTLLISGDLSDDGAYVAHQAIARELARAEAAGKQVFIIPGNHDIKNRSYDYSVQPRVTMQNISGDQIPEIYADFGYDEALARDENSLSYTANLNGEYRLIAIDCSFYTPNTEEGYVNGRNAPNMTKELLDWLIAQVEKCVAEGYIPIGMMHFPLSSHLGGLINSVNAKVNMNDEVIRGLTDAGLEYIFTGHLHSQDIASVENNGKTLYDIETGTLCNYSTPIRVFESCKRKISLHTESLDYINQDYIASFIPAADKAAILSNFIEYTKYYVDDGMKNKILGKADTETVAKILSYFGVNKEGSGTLALAEDIRSMIFDTFSTPLYEKQEEAGETSLERICKGYGVSIPASGYLSIGNLLMEFVRQNYAGDEGFAVGSVEKQLFKLCIYDLFYNIAELNVFGRLSGLNSEIPAVDLMPSMENLFKTGRLELVDNGFLAIFKSLEVIKDSSTFSRIFKGDSAQILNLIDSLGTLLINSYSGEGAIGAVVKVIRDNGLDNFIHFGTGELDLGNILDIILFGELAKDLTIDAGPADNNIVFKK